MNNYFCIISSRRMNIYIWIFIIGICIAIIVSIASITKNALLYTYATTEETFIQSNNILFMTHIETAQFLIEDNDNYVKNFSYYDLYARKVKSANEYMTSSAKLALSFTPEEKNLLITSAIKADEFFKTVNFSNTEYYKGLNGKDIARIQWVFALTDKIDEKQYEEGFPHTRDNIIFISKQVLNYNDTDLINTLIHEKIHIYQRQRSDIFKTVLKDMNYIMIDKNQISNNKLIRANPDLDGNIYYDKKTNKEAVCVYKNETPEGINDVHFSNFTSEHPYEKIAYDIAGMYYKTHIDKYKNV